MSDPPNRSRRPSPPVKSVIPPVKGGAMPTVQGGSAKGAPAPAAAPSVHSDQFSFSDKSSVGAADSSSQHATEFAGSSHAPTRAAAGSPSPAAPPEVPGYEIVGELGRGGMGVVYKARHAALGRTVALKMVLGGGRAAPDDLMRFRIEAEAIARMAHPNIVQVYEVGEFDGLPFFSLEFVEGGNLAGKAGGKPGDPRQAAAMVRTLAGAIHYAHGRNIVHRDLKPANVLLTPEGVPKVTDFGLAKRLGDDSSKTRTGVIMGTPSYMAPEQAEGRVRDIGPPADVYALGAILYELLTGRPPFRGSGPMETLMQVLGAEPKSPSTVRGSRVPADLETICLKCLDKNPNKRYGSADALADDLGRFLAGEPILARPAGAVERLLKWARRRPAAAALAAVSVVAGAALAVGGVLYNRHLSEANTALETARESAEERRIRAEDAEKIAKQREDEAVRERAAAVQARRVSDRRSYAAEMNLAMQAWRARQSRRTLELLYNHHSMDPAAASDPDDLRTWEWYYLWRSLHAAKLNLDHPNATAVAWSPDGAIIAVAGDSPTALGNRDISLWDAQGRRLKTLRGHSRDLPSLAFSPKGDRLASAGGDGTVRVWDLASGTETAKAVGADKFTGVAFAPSGRTLVAGCWDATIRFINADGGKPAGEIRGHRFSVYCVAISPDGKTIAGGAKDGVGLWDLEGRKEGPKTEVVDESVSVDFSPDGATLAVGGGKMDGAGAVRLVETATGKVVRTPLGHTGAVSSVRFSRDGKLLVSSGRDGTVRLWNASDGAPRAVFAGIIGQVTDAALSPDGRLLAAAHGGGVRVWDAGADPEKTVVRRPTAFRGRHIAADSDLTRVVTTEFDGPASLWRPGSPDPPAMLPVPGAAPAAAVSRDGRTIAVAAADALHLFDGDGKPRLRLPTGLEKPELLVFSPDGARLLAADRKRTLVFPVAGGEPLELKDPTGWNHAAAFSLDGRRIVCGSWKHVQWFDGVTGAALGGPVAVEGGARALCFSPDGAMLAAGSDGEQFRPGAIHIWNAATRSPVAVLRGHTAGVKALAFSADGRTLLSGAGDGFAGGELRCWDPVVGQERLALPGPTSEVTFVSFLSDGRRAGGLDFQGSLLLYEAAAPADTLIRHPQIVSGEHFKRTFLEEADEVERKLKALRKKAKQP